LLNTGCENPSGTVAGSTFDFTGYFIDGPVKGLTYITSSGYSGTTSENGAFSYNTGETVRFSLGNIPLGVEVNGATIITPLEICQVSELTGNTTATNMVRLLLALDTKENPYGITLPDNLLENIPSDTDLTTLLALNNADFITDAETLIEAITETDIDSSDIPSSDDAADHFEVSQELIDSITNGDADDNVFVTVKVPSGKTGSVDIFYTIEDLPSGIYSYTAGYSRNINSTTETLSFSESMYKGNWNMTLSQQAESSHFQVNDILSFYNSDGFQKELPASYALTVNSENIFLQADLSTNGAEIDTIYNVSGYIEVPKTLPNALDLKTSTENGMISSLSIYIDITDPLNEVTYASISVSPDWEDSSLWTTSGEYYQVHYSTSLPAGFYMTSQIYLNHGDYSGSEPDYDIVKHKLFTGSLNSDVSDFNFESCSWGLNDNYSIQSSSLTKSLQKESETDEIIYSPAEGYRPGK
jgi:hypothetical protein